MKYLHLSAKLFAGGKNKKIKLETTFGQSPLRDKVVDNLYQVLTISYDKDQSKFVPKTFGTLEDQKKLNKFKEKVVFVDGDTVELGNDMFQWVKDNFKVENFDATSNDIIVALADMLDTCEKQNEEESEKEYKAHKDDKPVTVEEYYKGIGYDVLLEDEPKK